MVWRHAGLARDRGNGQRLVHARLHVLPGMIQPPEDLRPCGGADGRSRFYLRAKAPVDREHAGEQVEVKLLQLALRYVLVPHGRLGALDERRNDSVPGIAPIEETDR